ncbi:MAG: hypothetical protein K2N51_01815 [Lachnospiraceae bacterium]|nr:hypothetical protein [Lachnospiraceae bacterium]
MKKIWSCGIWGILEHDEKNGWDNVGHGLENHTVNQVLKQKKSIIYYESNEFRFLSKIKHCKSYYNKL